LDWRHVKEKTNAIKSRKASQEACKTKREKKRKKEKRKRKRSYYVGDFNTMHQDHYSNVRQEETEKEKKKIKSISCYRASIQWRSWTNKKNETKEEQGQTRITVNQQKKEMNSKKGNKTIPAVYRESWETEDLFCKRKRGGWKGFLWWKGRVTAKRFIYRSRVLFFDC
jgi:hypothetical protein